MNPMEQHFGVPLPGFSIPELFRAAPEFAVSPTDTSPVSHVSLFHYADRHPLFLSSGEAVHHKVAREIYKALPAREKVALMSYLSEVHGID